MYDLSLSYLFFWGVGVVHLKHVSCDFALEKFNKNFFFSLKSHIALQFSNEKEHIKAKGENVSQNMLSYLQIQLNI